VLRYRLPLEQPTDSLAENATIHGPEPNTALVRRARGPSRATPVNNPTLHVIRRGQTTIWEHSLPEKCSDQAQESEQSSAARSAVGDTMGPSGLVELEERPETSSGHKAYECGVNWLLRVSTQAFKGEGW
jgi:hypothetical protein